jgi:hypothetical protein
MIDYVDPIPHLVDFFSSRIEVNVYGNSFPLNPILPALLVKNAGGNGFTRVQLICRAEVDFEAMNGLIQTMNLLERYASQINSLRVIWCERESNPFPTVDQDTKKPEAWCYMRLEHAEA